MSIYIKITNILLHVSFVSSQISRYESYIHLLEVWQTLVKSLDRVDNIDLTLFEQELWKGVDKEEKEECEMDSGLKRSHSSPSIEFDLTAQPVVKVRRNISERRTYRKIVIPRRNKEL